MLEGSAHGVPSQRAAFVKRHAGVGGGDAMDPCVDAGEGVCEAACVAEGERDIPGVSRREGVDFVGAGRGRFEEGVLLVGRAVREGEGLEEPAVHDVRAGVKDIGGEDDAGGLVEEVADGDVPRRRDDAVRRQPCRVDELRVSAGDEERQKREFGAGTVATSPRVGLQRPHEPGRQRMSLHVMDGHERHVPSDCQALGHVQSHC